MTVTVNINGLEPMVEAVNRLAQALGAGGVSANLRMGTGAGVPTAPSGTMPQQMPQNQALGNSGGIPGSVPTSSVPPMNIPGAQPGNPAPQSGLPGGSASMPGPIPTTAVSQGYSQDQIAVAMTGLVDQGKQSLVMQALAQFGASTLMQVPKEQYPALATQLRMLGANL